MVGLELWNFSDLMDYVVDRNFVKNVVWCIWWFIMLKWLGIEFFG